MVGALLLSACTTSVGEAIGEAPDPVFARPADPDGSGPAFADNDPHPWSANAPRPSDFPVHGIDVARYQNQINWNKVRRAGIEFAFIKATEGGDVLDARFAENWQGAKAAGIARGAYHFYYFCRPAKDQANWFIANVPKDANALPPVLDMEWNHASTTCKLRPAADVVQREMRIFLDIVSSHYGVKPLIYTTPAFYQDAELERFSGYEFWLRSVADHPAFVYPDRKWLFWQYTGTGVMPGISTNTDINVFYGDKKTWQAWLKAPSN